MYSTIAENYNNIFPLNPAQVKFIHNYVKNSSNESILEVGCGTGNLTNELSKTFKDVTGIDLDNQMIKKARNHALKNVKYHVLNMLDLQKKFSSSSFNNIVCFGNTLVHLNNLNEVDNFLRQASDILTKDGRIFTQIINYDRILDQHIDGLPIIENDNIQFIRNYHHLKNKIEFNTQLTIKATGEKISNSIELLPIRRNELIEILQKNHFNDIETWGSFKKDEFNSNSIPFILVAKNSR